MGSIVVTVVCLFAIGTALALLIRLRGAHRPDPRAPAGSFGQRLIEHVRSASGFSAAGLAAGILVAGFGGRLLMRVVAATSADSAQGRLTDAEAVVGEVTVGGSIFLILFGGAFGVIGGVVYYMFRRWLPAASVLAGLVVAGIGAGLLVRPTNLLNPESIDFDILGPRSLAAALVLSLVAGLGMLAGVLIDTLTERWPTPRRSVGGLAGLLPLLALIVFPPLAAIMLVLLLARAAIPPGRMVSDTSPVTSGLSWILIAAGAVGWLWTLVTAAQVAV